MAFPIIPVIMCGGAGTRLWPVSRESMPKQFVRLVGEGSTFQQVLGRISDPELFARPLIITHTDFRFVVAEQLRERGVEADIVLEPMGRDSGPAVAVSAVLAAERDRNALVLVLAAVAAAEGRIVTFGIEPTHPATSYGYIRPGEKLNGASARTVEAFVEKPDAATAATYMAQRYLWNSGNFLFHAATMLGEIERCEPAMAEAAKSAVAGITRDLDFLRLASEPFARAPKKSIDYAVMQRTKLAAVVPTDLGWSDIGSWSSVWEVLDHDDAGNATDGPVVMLDSRNSLVRSEESVLTTVVGLDDVIVVSTADAVLVSTRSKAEQVKALVEQLKANNHRAAVEHRRIYRPWGYYQDVDAAPRYRVKRIVVKPGSKLSLQKHFHRSEHWVVVKGTAEITLGNDVRAVHENESLYIPIGSIHRLANPGKIPLELIEVQVGSYLGDDDIVRLDDVYGR
ncbi:MAG TPA: mannose-1-phosphate guanylyltransferase/mannose-6-phosphate isomerase [Xanthobacteraceae bacterium]|nr:mannose-1-phosphate guanylyltransferase/mannose-6-phosphate isomerase [Xanthobacteraceae bacterium]